jgi:hypothetical protein
MIKKWDKSKTNWKNLISMDNQLTEVSEIWNWLKSLWKKLTQAEIIQIMTSFCESDKTEMINNWLTNIIRKNLSVSDLEKRPLSIDMIRWASDKDEISLEIQDVIMRSLFQKILENVEKKDAKELWENINTDYRDDFWYDYDSLLELKNEYTKIFKEDLWKAKDTKETNQAIMKKLELAFIDNKSADFTQKFAQVFKKFVRTKLSNRINRSRKIDFKTLEHELESFVGLVDEKDLTCSTKDVIAQLNKNWKAKINSDDKFVNISRDNKDSLMEIFYIQEKKAFYHKERVEQETVNKAKDIFTLPNLGNNLTYNESLKFTFEKHIDQKKLELIYIESGIEDTNKDMRTVVKQMDGLDKNKDKILWDTLDAELQEKEYELKLENNALYWIKKELEILNKLKNSILTVKNWSELKKLIDEVKKTSKMSYKNYIIKNIYECEEDEYLLNKLAWHKNSKDVRMCFEHLSYKKLKSIEQCAVKSENFESAAIIRDVVEDKKNEKNKTYIQEQEEEKKDIENDANNEVIKFLESYKRNQDWDSLKDYFEKLDNAEDVCDALGLKKDEVKSFVKELSELDQNTQKMEIENKNGGTLSFGISKKNVVEWNRKSTQIELDLNNTDKDVLKWLESPQNQLMSQSAFGKVNAKWLFFSMFCANGEVRLAKWYKIKVNDKYEWYLDHSKTPADFEDGELNKKDYPELFDEENEIKSDIWFLVDKNGDAIKDEDGSYIWIWKDNEVDTKIDVIDRKIQLEWENIDSLMNMFLGWKNAEKKYSSEIVEEDIKQKQTDKIMSIFGPWLEENQMIDNLLWWVDEKIDIGKPSEDDVRKNANLSDAERLEMAKSLIYKIGKKNNLDVDNLWDRLLELVLFAHYSTILWKDEIQELSREEKRRYKKIWDKYYEIGDDNRRVAGIYNYSKLQLKEKIKILQSTSGFENWQISVLMRYGICGIDPDKLEDNHRWWAAAENWIEENENYFEDDEFSPEHAKQDAKDYYQLLPEAERKNFVDHLKNNDSDVDEVNELKEEILEDMQNNPQEWNKTKTKANVNSTNINQEEENSERNKDKESIETPEEKFDNAWRWIKWHQSLNEWPNYGFESGTRLFVNIWWSLLPPEDNDASWLELELVETNSTDMFSLKIIWSDIKTDMDGKIITLPKTVEVLDRFKLAGDVRKMPKWNRGNRDKCLNNIVKSELFDKVRVFGTGPDQVKLKNGKLVNGSDESKEIKRFTRTEETYEIRKEKWWIGDDEMWQTSKVTTYEVTPLKNGKMRVKCNFKKQDPNDFEKDVRHEHTRDMDYTSFMLLMESKQLYGKSEKPKWNIDLALEWWAHARKWQMFQWFSPMAIIGSIKWIKKKLDEKTEAYRKDQMEDFEHLLVSREWLNIYENLGNVFGILGPGIFPGMQESMHLIASEHYSNRDKFTWEKIEKWYKVFEQDPHFSSMRREKLEKILMWEGIYKDRYQFAAAFLWTLKKDGPWCKILHKQMGKWFWVDKFLWWKHKQRFLDMQKKRKQELEEYKKERIVHWRQPRHEELSRFEFDYLVGVMDGRQPFGWIPGDDEFYQASKWSRTFWEKIKEWADEYFGSFEDKYSKIWTITFRQAEQEWYRHMRNVRPHKALPYLKAMAANTQCEDEEFRTKWAILWAMLSGVFKNMQDSKVRGEFWRISRTMWFLPGIWCRDTEQQENVLKMLDWVTAHPPFNKQFSKLTWYKVEDFEIDNHTDANSHFLIHTFPRYWKSYGKDILKIIEFKDRESDNSVIKLAETWPDQDVFKYLLEKSREQIREDTDPDVAKIYQYYEHSPLTANKWIVSKQLPSNGKFEQADNLEKEWAEAFWDAVWKNDDNIIPTKAVQPWTVEFIFGKYFNWLQDSVFSQGNLAFLIKWLKLVQKLKKEKKYESANYYLWYVVYGNVAAKFSWFPPQFDKAMKRFMWFFESNIDQIDENMIWNICGNEARLYWDKPFESLPMWEFSEEYMYAYWSKKSKYKWEYGSDPDKHINRQIDEILKTLVRLNIQWKPSIDAVIEEERLLGITTASRWWSTWSISKRGWQTKRDLVNNLKE